MRTNPPPGFSVPELLRGVFTFQRWEIFPGHKTNGLKDVVQVLDDLGVPRRLDGLRVLDIAPWNGFFSFECARRGAAEVVSLGPDDPERTGYSKVRAVLEAENCRYVRASVYDLSPAVHGTFDIVFCLGLIYHLRHPLLALDRIHDVARHLLYADSPIIDTMVVDQTVSAEERERILMAGQDMHRLPLLYFTKSAETGDPYNWFLPNRRAFHDLVESAGFHLIHTGDDGGGWAWLAAEKTARPFTEGIEGYNERAADFPPNN